LMYEFARWIGTGALGDFAQYGRYIGLGEGRLKDAEARIRAGGQRAIFLARFVPVLKTAIVVACGILGVPRRMYVPAMGLAALVYVGIQLALGYLFGRSIIAALEQIVIPLGLVVPLAVVGILLMWLVRARRDVDRRTARPTLGRTNRIRAGAVAGVLAIAGSTLAVNALIYLGGPLAAVPLTAAGGVVALRFPVELLYVLTSIVFVTVLGVFCGSIYGAIENRFGATWPDWLHGLAFAALPLVVSLLLLTPLFLFNRGPPATWLIAAVGEAMWWTMYGVLLGLIYPLFRAGGAERAEPMADVDARGPVRAS
jgi:hypothetical protein